MIEAGKPTTTILIPKDDPHKDEPPAPANAACVECGRGQYRADTAKIAIPPEQAAKLNRATRLLSVPCRLVMNHVPGDPHMRKCRGFVWQHEFPELCAQIKKQRQ